MSREVHRRLLPRIAALLIDEPVVAIQGPRTVGKSTILRRISDERSVSVLDLDDPATRDAVAADPVSVVGQRALVCIDEYQHVPILLDAIKAELNRELRPGRFLITGSTRRDALPVAAQALTGRLHTVVALPFSQGEIDGVRENLVERLVTAPTDAIGDIASMGSSSADRDDYAQRIVRGGFPLAVARTSARRARWFDDYIQLSLERDVRALRSVRHGGALGRLLATIAGQTGQILNVKAAAERAGLEPRTAEEYTGLLEAVFLIQRLPAWGTTLRARAAARPKVHVLDSGIAARLLRLTPERLVRLEPTAMTEFGHLVETFAIGEIRKQLSWLDAPVGCGHWRTHDGTEVDLVLERDDGSVVAIEIKAGRRVAGADLSGLHTLRAILGDRFAAGLVLYLGERSYTLDDRIAVAPLDRLWAPAVS